MDKKKAEAYRKRLIARSRKNCCAWFRSPSRTAGEADEEATQDIADKAANSYTKEFLFHQSDDNRRMLQLGERGAGAHQDFFVRPLRGLPGGSPSQAPGSGALGSPLHRVPGEAGAGPSLGEFCQRKARCSLPHPRPDRRQLDCPVPQFSLRIGGQSVRRCLSHLLFAMSAKNSSRRRDRHLPRPAGRDSQPWSGRRLRPLRLAASPPSGRWTRSRASVPSAERASSNSMRRAATALYAGKLRSAILQLKFRRRERLGKRLGELLRMHLGAHSELDDGRQRRCSCRCRCTHRASASGDSIRRNCWPGD